MSWIPHSLVGKFELTKWLLLIGWAIQPTALRELLGYFNQPMKNR